MTASLILPAPAGQGGTITVSFDREPLRIERPLAPFTRVAISAGHVVADPSGTPYPGQAAAIDWPKTIAFRRYLLDQGLGIAEAMDTAQRGMGLDWPTALELIGRTIAETSDIDGALIFSGCGTDQLADGASVTIDAVLRAYREQMDGIQALGGRLILMASRALVRAADKPADYIAVYDRLLRDADQPVILHWLGEMFDPALDGYWGASSFDDALETCLEIIGNNAAKIDGIKISLLDKEKEIIMRRRLPADIKMYTGDDFHYPELIAGDDQGFSHALLGIFDAIAPAASQALSALAAGQPDRYDALLAPTLPLARLIFSAPTRFYKTGVVFLAYLNGHQDHFIMLAGHQAMRPLGYFTDLFRLAAEARLLVDPDRAAHRMKAVLALHGVDAV